MPIQLKASQTAAHPVQLKQCPSPLAVALPPPPPPPPPPLPPAHPRAALAARRSLRRCRATRAAPQKCASTTGQRSTWTRRVGCPVPCSHALRSRPMQHATPHPLLLPACLPACLPDNGLLNACRFADAARHVPDLRPRAGPHLSGVQGGRLLLPWAAVLLAQAQLPQPARWLLPVLLGVALLGAAPGADRTCHRFMPLLPPTPLPCVRRPRCAPGAPCCCACAAWPTRGAARATSSRLSLPSPLPASACSAATCNPCESGCQPPSNDGGGGGVTPAAGSTLLPARRRSPASLFFSC